MQSSLDGKEPHFPSEHATDAVCWRGRIGREIPPLRRHDALAFFELLFDVECGRVCFAAGPNYYNL